VGVARADRFEELSRAPALSRVRLVPESLLERHSLPPTQRSYLHLALRGDIMLYDSGAPDYFMGIGAPLLSYGRLRWRSLTLWLNTDRGVQLETALSFMVYQGDGSELSVGIHGGLQGLKSAQSSSASSYRVYTDSYIDSYTRVSVGDEHYGLNARYDFSRVWIELSFDMADVSRFEGYDLYTYSFEMTRLGLSFGVAL
jgi:hypothetical protein